MRVRGGRRDEVAIVSSLARLGLGEGWAGLVPAPLAGRALATEWSRAATGRRLLQGGLLVAEEDGGTVGFADVEERPDSLAVRAVVTHPGYRRRGVGRALVRAASRLHPGRPLSVEVPLGSTPAERFCEGLDFVPGEVVSTTWCGEMVVVRRWWWAPRPGPDAGG